MKRNRVAGGAALRGTRPYQKHPWPVQTVQGAATVLPLGIPLVMTLGFGSSAMAANLRVPQSYATIQKAIDQALVGDVVLVSPGTYSESLHMKSGVSVTGQPTETSLVWLESPGNSPAVTFDGVSSLTFSGFSLVGDASSRAEALMVLDGASPVIENNTFTGSPTAAVLATAASYPQLSANVFDGNAQGIVLQTGSDATVEDNTFREQTDIAIDIGEKCFPSILYNTFEGDRVSVYGRSGAAPQIMGNTIDGSLEHGIWLNAAPGVVHDNLVVRSLGIGVFADSAQANIQHNHFDQNELGLVVSASSPVIAFNGFTLNAGIALRLLPRSYPSVLHNIFQDNGTAISLEGSSAGDVSPHIFNNTLVTGVHLGIHCVDQAYPAVDNNIVAFGHDVGIVCEGTSQPTLAYNLVYGNGGRTDGGGDYGGRCEASPTDFSADPLFVALSDNGDPTDDDLHLSENSPAIDAGNPQPAYNDADGSRNDVGAYGGPDFPAFLDMDGDGYTTEQGDCNDADPHVNPNAIEVEDGIDNDCDGATDETGNETPSPTEETSPPGSPGTGTPGDETPGTDTPGTGSPGTPTPGEDGGNGSDGGSGTPEVSYGEGCNCRTSGPPARPGLGAAALTALALVAIFRRRWDP